MVCAIDISSSRFRLDVFLCASEKLDITRTKSYAIIPSSLSETVRKVIYGSKRLVMRTDNKKQTGWVTVALQKASVRIKIKVASTISQSLP